MKLNGDAFAILFTVVTLFARPLSLIFTSEYLTLKEQGLMYYMIGTASIVMTAEMGVRFLIIRDYGDHSFKKANERIAEEAKTKEMAQFAYLISRFSMRVLAVIVLVYGVIAIGRKEYGGNESLIWVIYCISVSFSMLLTLDLSIMEALRERAKVYLIKTLHSVVSLLVLIVMLGMNYQLLALVGSAASGVLVLYVSVVFFGKRKRLAYQGNKIEFIKSHCREFFKKNSTLLLTWVLGTFANLILWQVMYGVYKEEDIAQYAIASTVIQGIIMIAFSVINSRLTLYTGSGSGNKSIKDFYGYLGHVSFATFCVPVGLFIFDELRAVSYFSKIEFIKRIPDLSVLLKILPYLLISQIGGAIANFGRLYGGEPYFKLALLNNVGIIFILYFFSSMDRVYHDVIFGVGIFNFIIFILMLRKTIYIIGSQR